MSAENPEQLTGPSMGPQLPHQLGRYTLCYELGAGGMATVYLSKMKLAAGIERLVAVKTIHGHLAKEKQFLDMFLDEAKIASQISHPNVCSVYDFGKESGTYYIAMEYLVGEPLFDVVNAIVEQKNDKLLEVVPYLAARMIADACEGLHAAHTLRGQDGTLLSVVHRDVSPQNLFVTYEGSVKVVDFGCAKALERVTQTNTGMMKGKVSYAAPEQLKAEELDARVDVFALGVCLWEALTLRQLFRRETAIKTAMAVLEERIPRATEGAPWVPEGLADIAAKALERDRTKRFDSARDMGKALRSFIAKSAMPFESAEVADWMRHLFEERHERTIALVQKVEELQLSRIAPVTARAAEEEASGLANDATKLAKTVSKSQPLALEPIKTTVVEDDEPVKLPTRTGGYVWGLALLVLLLAGGGVAYWKFQGPIRAALGLTAQPPQPPPEPLEEPVVPEVVPEPERIATHEAAHEQAVIPAPPTPVTQVTPVPPVGPAVTQNTARRPGKAPAVVPPAPSPTGTTPPVRPTASLDFSRGPVQIRTEGGWATVMHDGRELGRTPLRVTLPVGRQRLRLLPFGRTPGQDVDVNVEWGALQTVNVRVREEAPPAPRPEPRPDPQGTEDWGNPY